MSEWQPIETAPKDGTRILAVFGFRNMQIINWGGKRPPCWKVSAHGGSVWGTPTHWMALPDPPVSL